MEMVMWSWSLKPAFPKLSKVINRFSISGKNGEAWLTNAADGENMPAHDDPGRSYKSSQAKLILAEEGQAKWQISNQLTKINNISWQKRKYADYKVIRACKMTALLANCLFTAPEESERVVINNRKIFSAGHNFGSASNSGQSATALYPRRVARSGIERQTHIVQELLSNERHKACRDYRFETELKTIKILKLGVNIHVQN